MRAGKRGKISVKAGKGGFKKMILLEMFSPSKSRSKTMNTTRDVLSFFGWISALVSSTSFLVVSIILVSRVLLWAAIVYLKWLCYRWVATKPCHQNQPCSCYLYRYSQHITGYDPVLTTCLPIPSYTAICALSWVWYLSAIHYPYTHPWSLHTYTLVCVCYDFIHFPCLVCVCTFLHLSGTQAWLLLTTT